MIRAQRAKIPSFSGLRPGARLDDLLARTSRRGVRDPLRTRLAGERREALREAREALAGRARSLEAGVLAGDGEAIRALDGLAEEAMARMRAPRPGGSAGRRALWAFDRWLYRQQGELMDDPGFPARARAEVLETLSRFNALSGSYESFCGLLEPLVAAAEAERASPVVVHDLATGHGGFPLHLARALGARIRAEGSDLREEYLALGRAEAAREGLEVRFEIEDALSLGRLAGRGVDVLTCTNTLHHFSPGMIARMIGEASRAARVGVCFVDGERRWTSYALMHLAGVLWGRSRAFWHDSVVSIRRMLLEEELTLLASLAPGVPEGASIEIGSAPPAHVFVRIRRQGAP